MLAEVLIETIRDTILMLPLLILTYLFIELFERRKSSDDFIFRKLQKFGPLVGAFVGVIPQCGFSIIASMLFLNKNITLGTVISVFIATSDEAIPILLANPNLYSSMITIIVIKIILAIVVGYSIDKIIYRNQKLTSFSSLENDEEGEEGIACNCCYTQFSIPVSAILRAIKIYGFLFITSFILTFLLAQIGEDTLSSILLSDQFFQPVFAALFGFIPNCAASVVLTQLYVVGQVSFASLSAGLVSNAGLGLVVLFRYGASKKSLLRVLLILFLSAIGMGLLLQSIHFTIG